MSSPLEVVSKGASKGPPWGRMFWSRQRAQEEEKEEGSSADADASDRLAKLDQVPTLPSRVKYVERAMRAGEPRSRLICDMMTRRGVMHLAKSGQCQVGSTYDPRYETTCDVI